MIWRCGFDCAVVTGGQAAQGALASFRFLLLLGRQGSGFQGQSPWSPSADGERPPCAKSAGKGEFSALLKRGETLAGGFPSYAAHYKRRTTQRLFPTLRGSFYWRYGFGNPSVSLAADSSLCTREPWAGAHHKRCRRPGEVALVFLLSPWLTFAESVPSSTGHPRYWAERSRRWGSPPAGTRRRAPCRKARSCTPCPACSSRTWG